MSSNGTHSATMTLITNQAQKKKKKNKDLPSGLKESGDEEGGWGRERERKRESAGNPRISAGSLSVFLPQIQPRVGFGQICQTHARIQS